MAVSYDTKPHPCACCILVDRVFKQSILAWNNQFTTTRNILVDILKIGLDLNRLENNKPKVQIALVF